MKGKYPMHHHYAFAVKDRRGWKCSGCGFRPQVTPTNIQAVKAHITQKQKWEKVWQKCPTCKGKGKVKV